MCGVFACLMLLLCCLIGLLTRVLRDCVLLGSVACVVYVLLSYCFG